MRLKYRVECARSSRIPGNFEDISQFFRRSAVPVGLKFGTPDSESKGRSSHHCVLYKCFPWD
jgi:hypothetical protein